MSQAPAIRPRRSRFSALLAGATLAGLTIAAAPLPAVAQNQADAPQSIQPPLPPTKQNKPPVIMYYLIAVALGGAIVGVNMIPSKRGHQD